MARINAHFARQDNRTRALHISQSAPLKIAKTWARADGELELCLMDASPGMLDGDRYALDFTLEAGARVAVTTQGFARVHPSLGRGCVLETRLKIGENAILEWLPEPLMLYAGADLRAHTTVDLAPGATLLAQEIWCAGRVGRGESFAFQRFGNRWSVGQKGAPIFASSLDLEPRKFDPRALGALGNHTHAGSFWAWGAVANANLLETLWEIIENQSAVYAGASSIEGGVAVSMLGTRAHDLQALCALLCDRTRRALVDLR